jgi:DeoR/GlpR family transcriptional regulator of sugar metabolism
MIEKRKQKIMELIKNNGSVKVTELSQLFDVSEVTVRNYLADMESKGLLSRIHGGALSSYKPYYSMNMTQRLETNQSEKVLIAQKIAEMIEPNDTIMLNAGTTTLLAFRHLPDDFNLNIVTNSISIALEASDNPNFNVILIGGSVNTKYQFTFGTDAVQQLRKYHADKLSNNCGKRRTSDAHIEPKHKGNVKKDVKTARQGNKNERMNRVSHAADNGTDDVIKINRKNAEKANPRIFKSSCICLGGSVKKIQHRIRQGYHNRH